MPINAADYYRLVYGTTVNPVKFAAQAIPEVVDANGDGIPDILIFGAYYPFLGNTPSPQPGVVVLGKGDGTFAASGTALPASFGTTHPRELVQGDFNEDGLTDLFVADHGYDVSPYPGAQNKLLLGKAGGGYVEASVNLPSLADFSHSAAVGDINKDGHLDIFVGNLSGNASAVESYFLLGDGKGAFTKSAAGLPVGNGEFLDRKTGNFGLTASLLTDLNGDGRLDLVLGNDGNPFNKEHRSLVYWNTDGAYSAAASGALPQGYFGANRIVHDIAAMDLDGDGDNDLLLLSSESTPADAYADGWAIDVARNDNGVFTDATASFFKPADSHEGLPNENSHIGASEFIRLMDVNGDGTKDLVITQFMNNPPTADTPVVWTNDGFGHFEVALRAGQLGAVAKDASFVGVFTVPYMTANGLSFTTLGFGGDTIYQTTALATKPLPGPVAITATARNDLIAQNGSDNVIDGGAGLDTAVYRKAAAGYSIDRVDGKVVVRDNGGADGVDTLVNVERLRFADTSIALDADGNGGQAYRIYQAAFARTPDLPGLGYWMSVMDGGASLKSVAQDFVKSPEFATLYGANPSNRAIIEKFYDNVLHRPGDAAGIAFWVGELDSKVSTVADVLIGFSESAENKAALIGAMAHGFAYTPFG